MKRRLPGSPLFPYTTLFRSFSLSAAPASSSVLPGESTSYTATVAGTGATVARSEEHTSELQSPVHIVSRLLLEKKKKLDCRATNRVRYRTCYHTAHTVPPTP